MPRDDVRRAGAAHLDREPLRASPASVAGAVLALARWPNALMAAAGVLVGAWYAAGRLGAPVWWAAAAAAGLATFANADNDVCDADIDRVAHPARPIPSGALTSAGARRVAAAGAAIGVACSFVADPVLGVASVGVVAAMAFYDRVAARHGAAKNAIVAVLASVPFVYGAWAGGNVAGGVALAAVGAPLHLAREIAKDLDDAAADAPWRTTLPHAIGTGWARAVMVVATLAFAIAAARLGDVPSDRWRLLPAVVTALAAALVAARGRSGAPTLYKVAMLAAMVAAVTLRAT